MRFSFVASALALVAGAFAQSSLGPNAFNEATDGTQVYKSGQSYTLSWGNKQGNTVTILLRTGAQGDLHTVQTIVSNYQNTGSYSWTPDSSLATGADYALEIIDDDDQSQVNYSGQFVIQTPVEAVATDSFTSLVTVTNPSAAASSTVAASTTGSSASSATAATTTATTTGSMSSMTTKASTTTGSATASHSTHAATSATSAAVPANGAAKPAAGAVSGLLLVAAGFAIAL